jgi:methyl-accepting chemotaxis protein
MKNKFQNKFRKILRENPELEVSAMQDTLDDGTDISEFDVDSDVDVSSGENDVADALSRQQQQMLGQLQGWIDQVEQFLEYLNGDNPESIQSKLANAIPDTIMDKVKTSQQSKISRVASDLASFHQSLLGFKAQSGNASLRGV